MTPTLGQDDVFAFVTTFSGVQVTLVVQGTGIVDRKPRPDTPGITALPDTRALTASSMPMA